MNTFYANPYKFDLTGFYFHSLDDYIAQLSLAQRTKCSDFEHDIELIDGDYTLFTLCGEHFPTYCSRLEQWEELNQVEQKLVQYLVQDVGYNLVDAFDKLEDLTYSGQKPRDCAYDVAAEMGLTGFALQYFDCEAFARDCLLGGEWVELQIEPGESITITNLSCI